MIMRAYNYRQISPQKVYLTSSDKNYLQSFLDHNVLPPKVKRLSFDTLVCFARSERSLCTLGLQENTFAILRLNVENDVVVSQDLRGFEVAH